MVLKWIKLLLKAVLGIFELFVGFIFVLIIYIILSSRISPPDVPSINLAKRVQVGKDHYTLGENWLKKNDHGIWEMYIEGDPYERGLIYGELAKELVQKQERVFVEQINQFVPSDVWQQFLRLMLDFFNKDLPDNIPLENQKEIYGISKAFSDDYDYISSKYGRILNYHAAHDIGHALNDYSMVGCTSFALKDTKTEDGQLLIGRNFDFYVGDAFAEEKIVLFIKPSKGHAFISYSWAGFTGVASGLNEKGLSVTINASKSDLPTSSKTPIALLVREILQYASTIDEAIAIARSKSTFVSETIMVSSKKDGRAVLIEKSPNKLGILDTNEDVIVCANHYQSDAFIHDQINVDNIKESDSRHRFSRMNQLLQYNHRYTVEDAVKILRDQKDLNGVDLGMGNPRAINQLIAHHSVIIQPALTRFYVSTNDYQLGEFIGYDLTKVFKTKMTADTLRIAADPFLTSKDYSDFKHFKKIKQKITNYRMFDSPLNLSSPDIQKFIAYNHEYYGTYDFLGDYFVKKGNNSKALEYYKKSLTKKVVSDATIKEIKWKIKDIK